MSKAHQSEHCTDRSCLCDADVMPSDEFSAWMQAESQRAWDEYEAAGRAMKAVEVPEHHGPDWGISWGSVQRYRPRSHQDTDDHLRAYGIIR